MMHLLEKLIVKDMKNYYQLLLKEYSLLFGKVIFDYQKKYFHHMITHPSQLSLFED